MENLKFHFKKKMNDKKKTPLTIKIAQGTGEKMCTRVLKFSGSGLFFNKRILLIDEKEIRYYSKVPKGFKRGDFNKLTAVSKMGVPTALCEVSYPPVKWLTKKKKQNAIKLIFPQGSQMRYGIRDNQLVHYDKHMKEIKIESHVASIKTMVIRKKVEWVFVFREKIDLQKFVRIIETVTNPEIGLDLESIPKRK